MLFQILINSGLDLAGRFQEPQGSYFLDIEEVWMFDNEIDWVTC